MEQAYSEITQEFLLNRMLGRVPSNLDKRPSSVIFDTASATAVELQNLYIELEYLIKNSYGDTAGREFLVLLAKDRGIVPRAASKAVLAGQFVPETLDVSGQRFNIDSLNYTVTQNIAPGLYQVVCETPGTVGNQYLGPMLPLSYLSGLEAAELTDVLVPGEDEEDTEALRQRYLGHFDSQSFGGNNRDYQEKVGAIDGVGAVKITRVWNGDIKPAELIPAAAVTAWYENALPAASPEAGAWLTKVYAAAASRKLTVGGTVLVTVLSGLDFGVPSDLLIDNIQTILDPVQNTGEGLGLAPIGHVVNVRGAEPITINISAAVTYDVNNSWSNLGPVITEAIAEYLLKLRQTWAESPGLIVRVSQIENRILEVAGVVDVAATKINGLPENFTLGPHQIPMIGEVSDGA